MIVDEASYLELATDQFLNHHGVKGMKWGVRNEVVKGPRSSYTKGKKRAVKAVGLGVGILGARFMLRHTLRVPLSVIAGGAAGYAGAKATKVLLTHHGHEVITQAAVHN